MTEALAPSSAPLPRTSATPPSRPSRRRKTTPWHDPDFETSIRLRPSIAAPSLARNYARSVCAQRGLNDDFVRDVVFVAGELVAVSIRQVRAPLDLEISISQTTVTLRVRDPGAGLLARSRPDEAGTSRSLQLVQCLAQDWGVSAAEDGRQLWASLVFGREST
jgi:hypothetical protein